MIGLKFQHWLPKYPDVPICNLVVRHGGTILGCQANVHGLVLLVPHWERYCVFLVSLFFLSMATLRIDSLPRYQTVYRSKTLRQLKYWITYRPIYVAISLTATFVYFDHCPRKPYVIKLTKTLATSNALLFINFSHHRGFKFKERFRRRNGNYDKNHFCDSQKKKSVWEREEGGRGIAAAYYQMKNKESEPE